MSKKILVAFASVSGSTGEVAEAIGEVLGSEDTTVIVRSAKEVTNVSAFDAVVLGSSIRVGRWLPEAVEFLKTHQQALSGVPVAFFTTCLTMVHDTEESRTTVLAYLEPVLRLVPHIKPVGLGLFAGSLDPDRPMVMFTKHSPQGDYRDWKAIRAWAEEIRSALMKAGAQEEPIVLREAVLSYTDLSGLDLSKADLRGADLEAAKLSKADLRSAELGESDLIKADLHKADLQEAGLSWADLNLANMSGANLRQANLIGTNLSRAQLDRADLSWAILNGADLSRANLSGADLSYADMNWANLSEANLSRANLSEASLGWANLSGTNLTDTNLSNARYNIQTEWPDGFSPQERGCVFFPIE